MARYITDLTELSSSSFAAGDFIEVWHAAGGSNRSKKLRLDRFAMLAGAAFTGNVSVSGTLSATSSITGQYVFTSVFDNGTGAGTFARLERNNNASTPAPASLILRQGNNTWSTLWSDNSGNLRIGGFASGITSADINSGTVVGTQTSSLDTKDVIGEPDTDSLWGRIASGSQAVRRFAYKSGAFNGEEFSGVVVDYAPHYGMDRDETHPAGKSLNTINAIGDLLLAVSQLNERVAALEG